MSANDLDANVVRHLKQICHQNIPTYLRHITAEADHHDRSTDQMAQSAKKEEYSRFAIAPPLFNID